MKKLFCILLSALLLMSLAAPVFAGKDVILESLDNSAIGDSMWMLAGKEDEIYIYPYPRSAADQFDINKAEITSSNTAVLGVRPEKRDSYEFGCVVLTGRRVGSATVTVTDPGTGASCSVKVYVLPQFLDTIMTFLVNAQTILAKTRIAIFNALAIHI